MDEKENNMNSALENAGKKWTEETSGLMRADLAAAVRRRLEEKEARKPSQVVNFVPGDSSAAAPKPRRVPAWLTWGAMGAAAVALIVIAVSVLRGPEPVGAVSFGEGSLAAAQSRELFSGAKIASGADGSGVVLIDGQRVNVYMTSSASIEIESRRAIRLTGGEIWTRVEPGSGYFEVNTPHGKVEVHGTSFGVAVTSAGTAVTIASGVVEVGVGDLCEEMRPGRRAFVATGAAAPEFSDAPGDTTPAWAIELFKKASGANASLYLPSGALPSK